MILMKMSKPAVQKLSTGDACLDVMKTIVTSLFVVVYFIHRLRPYDVIYPTE